MDKRTLVATWLSLSALPLAAWSEQAAILVDGRPQDWADIPPAYIDAAGDAGASGIDLGRLWIADDDDFLFLRFELGTELQLDEDNDLTLYLDADGNAATGLLIGGIGADLRWTFGDRAGTFYFSGGSVAVEHADIRFRAGPTVSSDDYEVAIGLDVKPDGVHPLFSGTVLRIMLRDNASGGDQLPAGGQTLVYERGEGDLPPDVARALTRLDPSDVRLMTWNVDNDSPWNPTEQGQVGRQLRAVEPDIICFQEVFAHTAAQTAQLVEVWLPSGPGKQWYAAGTSDCKVVSRFDIIASWPLDGNTAALLDTEDVFGTNMLLISAHLPCCEAEAARQAEVDRILSFVREAKEPGGGLSLDEGSPIIIAGDMNFVETAAPLHSLLTGDISNEAIFGKDFTPDWDGSALDDLITRQTHLRMTYTWRNDFSSFWPGRLDFLTYTGSVLDVAHDFILYTPEMPPAALSEYNLFAADSRASDHLLLAADLRLRRVPGDVDGDGDVDFSDLVALLAMWGPCPVPPAECPADFDGDQVVGFADLLIVLSFWG